MYKKKHPEKVLKIVLTGWKGMKCVGVLIVFIPATKKHMKRGGPEMLLAIVPERTYIPLPMVDAIPMTTKSRVVRHLFNSVFIGSPLSDLVLDIFHHTLSIITLTHNPSEQTIQVN